MEEIITRYASAIVSIAKEEKKLEQYKVAVFEILEAFISEPKLFTFLKSYFASDNDKYKVIDELCSSYKLDNLTNYLKLLVKKHKICRYKDIANEIVSLINDELNIYEGYIYSTIDLDDAKIDEVEKVISKKLNRQVELKNKIDKRLIGGIKVVVHDHVFDGSIKYKLDEMKQNLIERRTTNEN